MAMNGASRRARRRGSETIAVSLFTIRYSVSAISIGENLPLTAEYQISTAARLRQSALQTPSRPIGAAANNSPRRLAVPLAESRIPTPAYTRTRAQLPFRR